ncbi:uracil-DNA glycosylase [Actinoalloteichus spitiensis]|uniref:uracil-DNA glycosylase n=1 Tax=Actinoalloteichus spitiensis TaxID=252394 RepID=UPI00037CE08D|nr:uracil-DNA glycosylase [Actinoalloteichus spitiensis]
MEETHWPAGVAPTLTGIGEVDEVLPTCRACPRLVAWREEVARVKRAAFRDEEYWGRPVPGFGPADAALAVVGLAPAAHGGNRTGRMFTGDRSGEVLYAAMYRAGLASRPDSVRPGDGLRLRSTRVTSPVHCAPPDNRPTPGERDTCRPWLAREFELLRPTLRAVLVLGGFGWQAVLPVLAAAGWRVPRPRPRFAHDAHVVLPPVSQGGPLHLLGCYHVSQRNTSTGRLSQEMVEDRLRVAAGVANIAE